MRYTKRQRDLAAIAIAAAVIAILGDELIKPGVKRMVHPRRGRPK